MKSLKIILFGAIALLLLVVVFGAGAYIGATSPFGYAQLSALRAVPSDPVEAPEDFAVFWQALGIVEDKYIDRALITDTDLTYGAIEGMLAALGDEGHTTFLTPAEMEQQMSDIDGSFSGIGAYIGVRDGLPMIVSPFDGSPAALAGIKAGDLIMSVDGNDTSGRDLDEIISEIRGPAGTDVTLTVLRVDEADAESLDITITRGEIDIPASSWAMVPGTDVAWVRLSQFNGNAKEHINESIEAAETAGATKLVLDLRNNPGGLLDQAIAVTSQFLTEGNVLQESDAEGNVRQYAVQPGGIATEIPMVVLINAGSASSSEIMAGALQDYGRAQLVGETTFGTGTVLEPFQLADGSALYLGTRQWLTAEGRLIRKQGIEPDVAVDMPVSADLVTADVLEEMTVEELLAHEDIQLLKALELLDALPSAGVE